jgi:hypothetical protein
MLDSLHPEPSNCAGLTPPTGRSRSRLAGLAFPYGTSLARAAAGSKPAGHLVWVL